MGRANYSMPKGASRRSSSGGNSGRSKRRSERHTKYISRLIRSEDRPQVEPFIMPVKIKNVIECQRNKLVSVVTLLHCLHSALRRQLDNTGRMESVAVLAASEIAEFPMVTGMLLEEIRSVHDALDSTSLRRALEGPL